MTVRFSTGLRNDMLGDLGLKTSLNNGVLKLYAGVQPASADIAAVGALLLEVTLNGLPFNPGSPTNGLVLDDPVLGTVSKVGPDLWTGVGIANGTAGWARYCGNNADPGTESAVLPRIDMSIAKSGADLNLSNTSIVIGAPTTVDVFTITMAEQ